MGCCHPIETEQHTGPFLCPRPRKVESCAADTEKHTMLSCFYAMHFLTQHGLDCSSTGSHRTLGNPHVPGAELAQLAPCPAPYQCTWGVCSCGAVSAGDTQPIHLSHQATCLIPQEGQRPQVRVTPLLLLIPFFPFFPIPSLHPQHTPNVHISPL